MRTLGQALLFSLLTLSVAQADNLFPTLLSKTKIQSTIGNFPDRGTQAEAMDDEVLLDWQHKRTSADCAYAREQSSISLKGFFGGPRGPLTDAEISSLPFGMNTITKLELGANIKIAKDMFDRPRPYLRNPMIKPCIDLESSSSYPSGHSTYARAMAIILGKRFPAKAQALLKRADEAALNRVIGGVHHPSDVEAGKKLGDLLGNMINEDDLL
jgi:acid phosphatase (class A)